MDEYINRNALLKGWGIELPKKRPIQGKQSKEFLAFMKKYENHPFYLAILDIYLEPSADVREVVHGEWKKMDKHGNNVQCSKCGNTLDLRGVNAGRGDANYCPNCGADMRGGTDGEVL